MGKSGAARAKAGDAAYGAASVDHELRLDMKGARRRVREVPPLIWSPYASDELPVPLGRAKDEEEEERLRQLALERIRAKIEVADERRNFTMMDAYAAHVEGARRSSGAKKLFQHAFLQFPTDLEITPETEVEMLAQAVAFINRTYGGHAAFHARLDRDEKGRHGVDVFFAPRYQKTTAKGIEDWISLSKFSKQLARDRFGQRQNTAKNRKTGKFDPVLDKAGKPVMVWNDSGYFQGRALQDAFFEHLRDSMGLDWVVRGERKQTRDHDRLEPEEYAAEAEKKKLAAAIQREVKSRQELIPRLKDEESPYDDAARDIVTEAHQKAAESAAERLQEAERQAEDLEASVAPLRAALAAMDAFDEEMDAYEAYDASEAQDVFRLVDTQATDGGWLSSSHYAEPSISVRVQNHATGYESSWGFPNKGEQSPGMKLHKAFQAAKQAGTDFWVRVTGWKQTDRTQPTGLNFIERPPEPPSKPTIAREVLRLLSRIDDRTLAAIREVDRPQGSPGKIRLKW